ncbi:hypothetical protein ONZ45_g17620 [Pleurotus djamor]|nr:hypothetical protein ONZ45_g17620 [Pleurotus djamor]
MKSPDELSSYLLFSSKCPSVSELADDTEDGQGYQVSRDYYLSDGDLFVLIDQTIFRIHSYFIRMHSSLLGDAMKNGVGSTLRNPLEITLVSESQFQKILWVFYDETFERLANSRKWLSILLTAEALEMEYVVNLAIHKLSGLPSPNFDEITLILIQDRHQVSEDWAVEAYCRLCKRDDPLSVEDAERLGYRLSTLISQAREAILKVPPVNRDKVVKDTLEEYSKKYPHAPPTRRLLGTLPASSEDNIQRGDIKIEIGERSLQFHRHVLITHSPLCLASKVEGIATKPLVLSNSDVNESQIADLARLFYDIIAQKYSMNHVGAFATKQLGDRLSLVDRITSLQRFKIEGDWADEVMDLVYDRDESLSVEENSQLGYVLAAQIWQERERRVKRELARQSKAPAKADTDGVKAPQSTTSFPPPVTPPNPAKESPAGRRSTASITTRSQSAGMKKEKKEKKKKK